MNSERNIVNKLFESKYKELEEAGFEANGSKYSCAFGHYSKDGEPISREEYFKAKGEDVKGDSKSSSSNSNKPEGFESPEVEKLSALGLDFRFDKQKYSYSSPDHYYASAPKSEGRKVKAQLKDLGYEKVRDYKDSYMAYEEYKDESGGKIVLSREKKAKDSDGRFGVSVYGKQEEA